MPVTPLYQPELTLLELGAGFYDPVEPASFPSRILRYRNERWAARIGLEGLADPEWTAHFGAFDPLPGTLKSPLALRYHGHQFQSYNPQIGDGRGFLYAQLRDSEDGRLLDLGTKGSGQTPYSRSGDGRLTLKGGVREVLITALLEALGVYTSKSLSLIETGERLYRGDEPSPTRSSVLVRLNHSHIRFGSFQRCAFEKNTGRLSALVKYAAQHYFPAAAALEGEEQVAAFLSLVTKKSAQLAASWMAAGFVHGVLNTDNMNITGESFDYGPYRMLPHFDPDFVAAYFDETGLYAYGRQPQAVMWNLKQLAGALNLICSKDPLVDALRPFGETYEKALGKCVLTRLGLKTDNHDTDIILVSEIFSFLRKSEIGFEQFFFDWYGGDVSAPRAAKSPSAEIYQTPNFNPVKNLLAQRAPLDGNKVGHAYFQQAQPCTLLIDEIEAIWDAVAGQDDWAPFYQKLDQIELMRGALQDQA